MKYARRRRCGHRSHQLGLPCLRRRTYDGYCGKHNVTCYDDDYRDGLWGQPVAYGKLLPWRRNHA